VPNQIFRQPIKSAGAPFTLAGNPPLPVIDLTSSGVADSASFGDMSPDVQKPLIVTFQPTGQMERITYTNRQGNFVQLPLSKLYLLVTLRKEEQPFPGANYKDLDAAWVAINPATGLVTVNHVASDSGGGGAPSGLKESREWARSGRNKGGQ
jgi:hypothetical protein